MLLLSADGLRQNVYTYDHLGEMSQLYRAAETRENRIQHRPVCQSYNPWTYYHRLAYRSVHQKGRDLPKMLKR